MYKSTPLLSLKGSLGSQCNGFSLVNLRKSTLCQEFLDYFPLLASFSSFRQVATKIEGLL